MHAVVLHRNTCSPMRRLHRARSNRSNPRLVRIKLVTTTYAYDNNGNLTSAGTGTATTSYSYDYANRLIAILYNNATTSTYGYDAFGARVDQISASTSAATTTYPFKFYSMASTTKSSTNFATSTEYVFNGDTLLATVDQAFSNGSAQARRKRVTYTRTNLVAQT